MWGGNLRIFQLSLNKLMEMDMCCTFLNIDHWPKDKVCLKTLSKTMVILIINGKFLNSRMLVHQIQIIGILLGLLNLIPYGITNLGISFHLTNGNNRTEKFLLIIGNNKIKIGSTSPTNGKPHKVTDNSDQSGNLTRNMMPYSNPKNKD